MTKLVKIDECINDNWTLIEADETVLSAGDIGPQSLLPLETYLELADSLPNTIGVWLKSDENAERLTPFLEKLPVIACRFSSFADGRSFSQARVLRDQLEFSGDIRGLENFIQDQMFYMMRCGFSSFSVPDDADFESLQESLRDFSESYQAACDISEPLFRRRA